MSREIMQQALSAFEAIMFEENIASCQIIAKLARYALREELAKPEQQFYPDWDMLKPYHERIKELETQLAQTEQETTREKELLAGQRELLRAKLKDKNT